MGESHTLKYYRSQRQQYFEMQRWRNIKMDKQTVIQNILTNYGKYGITAETILPLIDSGEK